MALAFLFRADYADGSFIQQSQADISALDPARSQFFDVLQRDGLVRFTLVSVDEPDWSASVNLLTGSFMFDGSPLPYHDPSAGELDDLLHGSDPVPFRLIYFRRVYQHRTIGGPDGPVDSTETHYFLGWQLTVGSRCYKQTLRIT